MRRKAVAVLMVAALGGCMSGPETGGGPIGPHWGKNYGPPPVPGVKGPYGEGIAMAAPYNSAPPPNAYIARQMMSQSIPLSAVQMNNPGAAAQAGMPPESMIPYSAVPRGPLLSPPGVPFGPGVPAGSNFPGSPSGPGMLSGVQPSGAVLPANMPMGGGVINANIPPGMMPPGGIMQTQLAQANPATGIRFPGQRTQVRFVRPSGMKISWFTQGPNGQPMFSTTPIEAPGRYNFPQAAIYRLKLSNIEGRPGLEIYPTMEVVPCNPRTEAFLAHSAVPIEFTNEDFKQIAEGNYLVKVIYLPDPQFQDVAGTGTDEILSTRLEPGADPIQEALRRGSILVVLRMGNVDQEAPNTPPLNSPGPNAGPPMMPPPGQGMMPAPNLQLPFWGMQPGMPMGNGAPQVGPPGMIGGATPPAPLNIPSRPLPDMGTSFVPPNSQPSTRSTSGVPGISTTNKFLKTPSMPQEVPPVPANITPPVAPPAIPEVAPALPQNFGPAFPPTPGNIQTPMPPGLQGQPEQPTIPGQTPRPVSRALGNVPATAQLAGQVAQ